MWSAGFKTTFNCSIIRKTLTVSPAPPQQTHQPISSRNLKPFFYFLFSFSLPPTPCVITGSASRGNLGPAEILTICRGGTVEKVTLPPLSYHSWGEESHEFKNTQQKRDFSVSARWIRSSLDSFGFPFKLFRFLANIAVMPCKILIEWNSSLYRHLYLLCFYVKTVCSLGIW